MSLQQDQHGLGFDPFAGAEDFRALKKRRVEQREQALQQAAAAATSKLGMGGGAGATGGAGGAGAAKRPRGIAFGGVADDLDTYG